MMRILFSFAMAALFGTVAICGLRGRPVQATPQVVAQAFQAEGKTVTLRVEGMTCGSCTFATRKVLERLEGVKKAEVSYEKSRAVVQYDPAKVSVPRMIAAVRTLGYTATVVEERRS